MLIPESPNDSLFKLNYNTVIKRIEKACEKAGRPVSAIELLAVSKLHGIDKILSLHQLGANKFGENYVQEALLKIQRIALPSSIQWYFIGPVQSNKTKLIAENFDWVLSLDRLKIAQRLSAHRACQTIKKTNLNICLQINISEESSKSGFKVEEIVKAAEQIRLLPYLNIRGLMGIPAAETDFEKQRRAFRVLKEVFDDLCYRGLALDTLSMGMSHDLEAAIAEGSTQVRIGTALFGQRVITRS